MGLKEKNNFKKFFKKYMIWIVLVVAILIIPATNAKYILQKSASLELKPDQYRLFIARETTLVSASSDKVNFRISNFNNYPVNLDIVYNGNVISTGITVPASTQNYVGDFSITQTLYDELIRNDGADMDIKVISPYSVDYPGTIRVDVPAANLDLRYGKTDFFGNNFDITKIATVRFSDQGIVPPATALGSFDVSEGKKGNVVAWYTKNAADPSMYDVVISAYGKVKSRNANSLFAGFTGLTNVDFTNFNAKGIYDFSNSFRDTKSLKNINWGGLDTSSVKNFGTMFSGSGIKNLDMSSLDWSKVRDTSLMFKDADKLESLNLTGINTASLINIHSMYKIKI